MNIGSFLRDKLVPIFITLITAGFAFQLLHALGLGDYAGGYLAAAIVFGQVVSLAFEYIKKHDYYEGVRQNLERLDRKYLISEMMEEPSFIEGKVLYEVTKAADKSMNDEIAKHRLISQEYREYIETWVHEIKTPISSSRLIMENNPGEVIYSLSEELSKIENFVDQALFYSRSSNVEKDYVIKQASLKDLVGSVLKKHSSMLIEAKISIKTSELDKKVYTDVKWTDFILGQILMNSVKYRRENPCIELYGTENENSVTLIISDNGSGIPRQDLNRVFQKGFTGNNGRSAAKSTGMGLYLCKKLCEKMNLGISITSEENRGTAVSIVFPKSNMYS